MSEEEEEKVVIPPASWNRKLNVPFTRSMKQFEVGFTQMLPLIPLGVRMMNYCKKEQKRNRIPFMDPFATPTTSGEHGVPLGGIGCGSVGRGWQGQFNRWGLGCGRPDGVVVKKPVSVNAFHCYCKPINSEDPSSAKTVTLLPNTVMPPPPSSWKPFDSTVTATYHALFPRAWWQYEQPTGHPVRLVCEQISPVWAHNYQESSYPCSVFEWTATNTSNTDAFELSLMFTWQNGIFSSSPGDSNHPILDPDGRFAGVTLQHLHEQKGVYGPQGTDPLPLSFTIAAASKGTHGDPVEVSFKTGFNAASDGSEVWTPFSADGTLPESEVCQIKHNTKTIMGGAVAAKAVIPPAATRKLVFSLCWDCPFARFGKGVTYQRRYTQFFKKTDGSNGLELTREALTNYKSWQKCIVDWQQPILISPSPDWYKAALFNELYYLVEGGSVWTSSQEYYPLRHKMFQTDQQQTTTSQDKEAKANDSIVVETSTTTTATTSNIETSVEVASEVYEDTILCKIQKVGHFQYLEGHEYLMTNTYDVHFYASFALAACWPLLQLSVQLDFCTSVPFGFSIDAPSATAISTSTPRSTSKTSGVTTTFLMGGEKGARKTSGAVPHDIGSPVEDPGNCLNIYCIHDTTRWKDLPCKFVLISYRDYRVAGSDRNLLEALYPTVKAVVTYCCTHFVEQGILQNEGFADQTYDAWKVKGVSSYSGGLWLAALTAAVKFASAMEDSEHHTLWSNLLAKGKQVYQAQLWNGKYFNYDSTSQSIMADQLCGQFWCLFDELDPIVRQEQSASALNHVFKFNVQKFGEMAVRHDTKATGIPGLPLRGAVNGMTPDGKIDSSSMQSQEVWTGTTYLLAAHMLAEGLDDIAWKTARGLYEGTYEQYGYWFSTPEAWTVNGSFRSLSYMRPLAVWAMQMVLDRRPVNHSERKP